MAQRDYSEHQQRIITKYYNQLDTIMLQKLQELVGELYLETPTPNASGFGSGSTRPCSI
jgi:hypothetical protein